MQASPGSGASDLAGRLDKLEQLCARLARENAELRERVSRPDAAPTPAVRPLAAAGPALAGNGQAGALHGPVSRRSIGRTLGIAAAGVVGAAALSELSTRPAAASTGDAIAAGQRTTAELPTVLQYDGPQAAPRSPVVGLLVNDSVFGPSDSFFNCALAGWSGGGANAGSGGTNTGVYGYTDSSEGYGVVGINNTLVGAKNGAAVLAHSFGQSAAVQAISKKGRGGVFSGPTAQVRLVPGTGATHPRAGGRGDLYVDNKGRLWFCKVGGNNATWHQIA